MDIILESPLSEKRESTQAVVAGASHLSGNGYWRRRHGADEFAAPGSPLDFSPSLTDKSKADQLSSNILDE